MPARRVTRAGRRLSPVPGARRRARSEAVPHADVVLIGIGANLRCPGLGPLTARPALASRHLARAGLRPRRLSPLYGARPWPGGLGPRFVNAVALVRSRLAPPVILGRLLAIERAFGRPRRRRNAPRRLDLDLLAVGDAVTASGCEPVLPHPGLRQRAFVLRPLLDVLPTWRHPLRAVPARTLLAHAPRTRDTWPWERTNRRQKGASRLKTR